MQNKSLHFHLIRKVCMYSHFDSLRFTRGMFQLYRKVHKSGDPLAFRTAPRTWCSGAVRNLPTLFTRHPSIHEISPVSPSVGARFK